ncbi:MAG: hypothetical protein C4B56_06865 [Candidatus Methanophagaceae archaeon]|nr:MAG: hypothetical protein C4B56_06865 [Methanophagales archaeon]
MAQRVEYRITMVKEPAQVKTPVIIARAVAVADTAAKVAKVVIPLMVMVVQEVRQTATPPIIAYINQVRAAVVVQPVSSSQEAAR